MKPPALQRAARIIAALIFGLLACGSFFGAQNTPDSKTANPGAGNPKLNSDFLRAIEKGDIKKINALAQAGARVNRPDTVFDIEDLHNDSGLFRYRIRPTDLVGASVPMRQAIRWERPESVRALLALGADVKTEFYQSASVGMTDTGGLIDSAIRGQARFAETGRDGSIILDINNGGVVSKLSPTPAKKATYLSIAQEQLAVLRRAKSREKMQEVVDVLKQTMKQ